MDLTTLRAVLAELRPWLVPSRFEKAQQSDGHTLQLGFRSLSGRHWLELSWQAEAPRLLAIAPPPRGGDGSTLAQQVQHGLAGLALVGLQQEGMERVVELQFAPRPGDPVSRRLVLELMGRHSNLFVLDGQGRVTGAARQVREQQSRLRPIGSGDAYLPPPPAQGQPPRASETYADWRRRLALVPMALGRALRETYQGISPALALQLAGDEPLLAKDLLARPVTSLTEPEWQQLHHRWQCWLAVLASEAFALSPGRATAYRCWQEQPATPAAGLAASTGASMAALRADPTAAPMGAAAVGEGAPAPATGAPNPLVPIPEPGGARSNQGLEINRFLEAYHQRLLDGRRLQQRSATLRLRLQQALAKEQAQCRQQQERLDQVEGSGALQSQADGLLCLADPSREQVAEAQALYRRARKLRRSVAAITPRIEAHQLRIEQLEASLTYLDQLLLAEEAPQAVAEGQLPVPGIGETPSQGTTPTPGLEPGQLLAQLEDLEGDSQSLLAPRLGNRRQRRSASGATPASGQVQPLELELPSGLRLQVGRNHRQNAWISLQQARRGDLWFHAQECPGSHVVLKASLAPCGEADLQAAADLAAHFSRARGNRRVPVIMVATDQLQRIPGAGPGTVRHRGGEVLWAEPQRAASLLHELADRANRPISGEAPDKQAPERANPAPIPLVQAGSVQPDPVQPALVHTAQVQTSPVQTTPVQTTSGQPASAETTPVAAPPAGGAVEQALVEQAVAAPALGPPNAVRLPSLGPAPKP